MLHSLLQVLLVCTLCGATYHVLRHGRVPGHLIVVSALILVALIPR